MDNYIQNYGQGYNETSGQGTTQNQPMSELDLLRQQQNIRTDETLDATRRILTTADETQKVGAATLEQLYHQGEQLDKINQHTDEIHQDIKQTEKNLDKLEKCCGIFVLPWKRVKRPGQDKHFKPKDYTPSQTSNTRNPFSKGDSARRGEPHGAQNNEINRGPYIQRITNDAREDEMEENLQQVGNIVGELKTMAIDMNQEVSIHNRKLDDINAKTTDNQMRLDVAQTQAERIVGKPKQQSSSPVIPTPGIGMVAKQMAKQTFN